MTPKIVLQQAISGAGLCSRRQAESLIKDGRVKVNNSIANPGARVDPVKDKIVVKGKLIKKINNQPVYYLVNKPIGYACTVRDKFAHKKVIDLVPAHPRVWPVGRLDKNSHGLIILTNDGELTHKLTHPSFQHAKEYLVEVDKTINHNLLNKLKQGITLEHGLAKADQVKKINTHKLSITLHQGWKRQIRRMLQACGYHVLDLERIRIGEWKLGKLKSGEWKNLKL